ncbi:hypothetical protein Pth03_12790 [Planotetraspora thailandica]|uniref:Uncharacterized protein n=1 Tax=Planotetraspora thailandica TaxID=487172 RepID=A0A8J3VA32_9ACTN|nr:FG-GAP repeat protein [Planotetraspora thailandica]GII52890.1 hypothetical protein Pth03_12790 [Planotetraspora thailandica]
MRRFPATTRCLLLVMVSALVCAAAMSPAPPSPPPVTSDPTPPSTPIETPTPTPSVSPSLAPPPPTSAPTRFPTPPDPRPPRKTPPEACPNAGKFDFDGDGQDDAVVGDQFAGFGSSRGGRLFLLRGRAGAPLDPVIEAFESGVPGWTARPGHIDGDRCMDLVVANPFADSSDALGSGMAYVFWGGRDFGRVGSPRLELRAPKPRAGARFGWSVAVRDHLIAMGAPYEDADGETGSGAVYLFQVDKREPGRPKRITQESPGVPGASEAGDLFGWSVTIGRLGHDPDMPDLAVGAPFEDADDAGGDDAGAVTVLYDVSAREAPYEGAKWDLHQATDEVPATAGDRFGYSLRYGKNGVKSYLAVGAPLADPERVRDAGVVVLFEVAESGPRFLRVVRQGFTGIGEHLEQGDRFGASVAFSGPYLLVGIPGEGSPEAPESGAVGVVPLADGPPGWMQTEDDPRPYDHFGASVGPFGEGRFLIGAPDRGVTGAVTVVTTPISVGGRESNELSPTGAAGAEALDFGSFVTG